MGFGGTLLYRAVSGGGGAGALVLASTGLLATLNLAVTDSTRYASAKRVVAKVENPTLPLAKLAKRWYNIVRVQVSSAPVRFCASALLRHLLYASVCPCASTEVFGQLAALVWMARATSPTGVLRGGVAFMAANVAFFVLSASDAKHDDLGLPAPMKPGLQTFVLTTDAVLMCAALCGALAPAGSICRAAASGVFATGCLIGAAKQRVGSAFRVVPQMTGLVFWGWLALGSTHRAALRTRGKQPSELLGPNGTRLRCGREARRSRSSIPQLSTPRPRACRRRPLRFRRSR